MRTMWLSPEARAAWLRMVVATELPPGVLDAQLRRDSGLSHFAYLLIAMPSGAPDRMPRMTTPG